QIGPICKKYRRFGERRSASQNDPTVKKAYPPGMHGQSRRIGSSEYGRQLEMKQKIKMLYGVMERQFRRHYAEAQARGGLIGLNLLQRLETRLDNVVFRAGLANTRAQARQIVNHGFILVNGRKLDIPSAEVKVGDVISVKPSKLSNGYFKAQAEVLKNKKDAPAWLLVDDKKWEVKITALPSREDVDSNINPQIVVEFYSK
ncbi:MAG TPA: 30S ribosomal protein S4, partial [Candidatus Moranbacteria bacterium]|nr:30S ribosomal protein S4 [Candidatus Moranbacteria bacterium]